MKSFAYEVAIAVEDAVHKLGSDSDAALLGGGTNLVDLMKLGAAHPSLLIDIAALPPACGRGAGRRHCPHRGWGFQ